MDKGSKYMAAERASMQEENASLVQIINDQRKQIAKLERLAMANHIVKHLEHEVGTQLDSAN